MSNSKRLRYYFEEVTNCEMCGDSSQQHIILGQRLNQSQGLSPKRKQVFQFRSLNAETAI
ncbi:MAG: hypothetical protein JST09_02085 [Bacteroidetes bacterium]|nr:hypothetical protein [Bacteroidota bacterium]